MLHYSKATLLVFLCLQLYSNTYSHCFRYKPLENVATRANPCSFFRLNSNDLSAESCITDTICSTSSTEVGLTPKPFHCKNLIKSAIAIQLMAVAQVSSSVAATISSSSSSSSSSSAAIQAQTSSISTPVITHKVFLDIKIANYTEESIGKNRGALGSGRVVFGLYGKDAPQSVDVFLRSIDSDGKTVPSYINTQFARVSEEGVLEIEKIRGLNTVTIAGIDQYEYAGEVLDYKPILEANGIKHSK